MTKTIFLIAGEPSGDILGGRLMRALKTKSKTPLRFVGVGGPRMIEEGLEALFPYQDLAVFGLAEFLPKMPQLFRRLKQTIAAAKAEKLAALITIDLPGFSFRVARALKGQGVPLIHYVAPSVWAWRPGRAKKIARLLDHLITLFAFEPPYFTREGLATDFVGHAVIESGADRGDGARFRAQHNIGASQTVLTVLPGSRMSELTRLMPVFGETLRILIKKHPAMVPVIPVVPHLADRVRDLAQNWPIKPILVMGDTEKYDVFAASQAALAASGTVVLELALAKLPMVIAYKLHWLTVFLYERLLLIDHYSLVNILHTTPVVPELMQEDCTPENCAREIEELLGNSKSAAAQRAAFDAIRPQLQDGTTLPSDRAADVVLRLLA